MKKFFLAIAICLAVACAAKAEKKPYSFGFRASGTSTNQAAQYKLMSEDVFKAISQRMGIEIKTFWFNIDDEFTKTVDKKGMDIIWNFNADMIYTMLKQNDYKPFMAASSLGYMKTTKWCAYVNKDSNIKSVMNAKNRKLGFVDSKFDYFLTYKIVGSRPEDFFGSIEAIPNGESVIYALSLGKLDVVAVAEFDKKLMEMTNPGAVKNIRELSCVTLSMPPAPFMRLKTMPDADAIKIVDILKNWRMDKAFSKYRALLEAIKAKFIPVTEKDYAPFIKFYDDCIKKGWDKDYQRWIKSRK
jgi:ABC-type phosphate/phosphonate transport system substrate-binding protein